MVDSYNFGYWPTVLIQTDNLVGEAGAVITVKDKPKDDTTWSKPDAVATTGKTTDVKNEHMAEQTTVGLYWYFHFHNPSKYHQQIGL